MNKIGTYLLTLALIVSSISFFPVIFDETEASQQGAPAPNSQTFETWIVGKDVNELRQNQWFRTQAIKVENGGNMEWRGVTAYIDGDFFVNDTKTSFKAIDSTIYFNGNYFNITGRVELLRTELIMNNSYPGESSITVTTNGSDEGSLNVTQSFLHSNNAANHYNFNYTTNSHGLINDSYLYNIGLDRGLFLQTSNVVIDNVQFKYNFNHISVQDASPQIKNSSFYSNNAAELTDTTNNIEINISGNSRVHVVSSFFNSSKCVQVGIGELYEDYFVIFNVINRTKGMGVGNAQITIQDQGNPPIILNTQTSNAGPALGFADPVRCTAAQYTDGSPPNSTMNPYIVTALDSPENELQVTKSLDIPSLPKDSKKLINYQIVFDFIPMIDTTVPENIVVVEGIFKYQPFQFHDKDYGISNINPSEVNVTFRNGTDGINWNPTTLVTYDKQNEQVVFQYPNNQQSEKINISVTDVHDNFDFVIVNVTFTPVNNAPSVSINPQNFDVYQDKALYLDVILVDVDNKISELSVGTDSPYFTYISSNETMKVLYPNEFGPDKKQDTVEIWAHDGISNSSSIQKVEMIVTFHQTPDPPEIIGTIEDVNLDEDDEPLPIDLSANWRDPDYDVDPIVNNLPGWYVYGNKLTSIKVSNENFEMEITPLPEANGEETVTLVLEDPDGLNDTVTFKIKIKPINDAPYVQEWSFDPVSDEAGDDFTFFIKYFDMDNDPPSFIRLRIDNDDYPMTGTDSGDTNYKGGKQYSVVAKVYRSDSVYTFFYSDGKVEDNTTFNTPKPSIVDVWRYEKAWSINKELMVLIKYSSKLGGTITINENPSKPSNRSYPMIGDKEYLDIERFYGISTDIKNIAWIYLELDIKKADIPEDIFVSDGEIIFYYYSPSESKMKLTSNSMNDNIGGRQISSSNFTMALSSEVVFVPLAPYNDNVDGDGCLNEDDAFPKNASECLDDDGDGIGNNADAFDKDPAASVDTDGDGYPDYWNPGKNQGDSTTGLYLDEFPNDKDCHRDLDKDGTCDKFDTDSDGDGMEDQWEIAYGFDEFDPSDADLDFDGDGYTNLEEFKAETDPTDPTDFPEELKPKDGIFAGNTLTLVALVIIIVLVVIAAVFLMRKPKKKEEPVAPAAPPYAPPPAAGPPMEPAPQIPPGTPQPEFEAPQVPAPELPAEGELPALGEGEAGLEEGVEGEGAGGELTESPEGEEGEFAVGDDAGESLVPQPAEILAEGEEAEDIIDGDELLEDDEEEEIEE